MGKRLLVPFSVLIFFFLVLLVENRIFQNQEEEQEEEEAETTVSAYVFNSKPHLPVSTETAIHIVIDEPTSSSPRTITTPIPTKARPTRTQTPSTRLKPTETLSSTADDESSTVIATTPSPTSLNAEQCLAGKPRKDTRPHDTFWNCSSTIRNDSFEFQPLTADNIINIEPSLLGGDVTFLTGGNWGQLCNKLGMIAGTLATIRKTNRTDKLLAVQPSFSEVVWALDMDLLSQTLPGILLDCIPCTQEETAVRCSALYIFRKGLFDVSSKLFPVSKRLESGHLFYKTRPRNRGYVRELVERIRPSQFLLEIVHGINRKWTTKTTVAIHRRYMDSQCYTYYTGKTQYNCFPNHFFTEHADTIAQLRANDKRLPPELKGLWQATDGLRVMEDDLRTKVESSYPMLLMCNYTFSPVQVQLINNSWVPFADLMTKAPNSPVTLIVADDDQTPLGRKALEINFQKVFGQHSGSSVVSLQDLERPSCFANKRFHNMLADMIVMAESDLHMGNAVSSCDDIVAHWRKSLGKSLGTSFPNICYDKYYTGQEK